MRWIRSKALRMQVSMPSASTSTFMMPSVSRSSLSHSMKVRSSIAAFPIGTVCRAVRGQHEAADMLGQMARKAGQFVGEMHRAGDRRHWRDRSSPWRTWLSSSPSP